MIKFLPNKRFLWDFITNGYPSGTMINGLPIDSLIQIGMLNYRDKLKFKEVQDDLINCMEEVVRIYETLNDAYKEMATSLGDYPVNVFLTLLNNDHTFVRTELHGIMAHTLHDNTIVFYISSKNMKDQLFWWHLKVNFAHEYVHVIRNTSKIGNKYLIDYCIDEGLAEYKVYQQYGISSIRPWAKISEETIQMLKKQIISNAYISDKKVIFKFLQGDYRLKINRWTGYQVGFYIIDSLVKSDINMERLLLLSGTEVLNLYEEVCDEKKE